MTEWRWPGNIRELQNFIERAVILATGERLEVPLEELGSKSMGRAPAATAGSLTLREVERNAILDALRKSRGRVGGPRGAAALLGLKRTTLQSRMRLLNIETLMSADCLPFGRVPSCGHFEPHPALFTVR